MDINIISPDECPFRSEGRGDGCCNIALIACNGYDSSYPFKCPLLDAAVVVQRVPMEQETK